MAVPVRQIVLGLPAFEAGLRLLVRSPQAVVSGAAGVNRTPCLVELLGRELHLSFTAPTFPTATVLLVTGDLANQIRQRGFRDERLLRGLQPSDVPVAILAIGEGVTSRTLSGVLISRGDMVEDLHCLKLVGSGMHRILTPEGRNLAPSVLAPDERERWSRLIGALGGEEPFQRLRSLHYALIGVGRTGSLVATSLARAGVQRLTLIDPDHIEIHNLDAMSGVALNDIGRHKAEAVTEAVMGLLGQAGTARAVPGSVTTMQAFVAAKEADVLVTCVDHDGARVAAAMIATLYAKVHLDIGTGVFGGGTSREIGADIRLLLPGERCVLCMGGVANLAEARSIFASPGSILPVVSWPAQRAGSLRSLNQIAAHLGLRLLEDLVGERVTGSTWLHLEFDPQGLPTLQPVAPLRDTQCALCQRAGLGDGGLDSISNIL